MKKLISLLLVIVMVLGLVPMTVMAEEAAACPHAVTTESVSGNGDGTHNKTVVCSDCGEAVVQDTVSIDFKADFAAASEEDFWAGLTTTTLANGGEVKRVGTIYNGAQEEGNADAFSSLNAWLAANKGWSFDDTTAKLATNAKGTGQKLYFNTDDDALWGLGYNGYYIAMTDGRSSMGLNVQVDEAGTYDLSVDLVLSNSSSKDYDNGYTADNKQVADSGGAKNVHVIVNGETVITGVDTVGATAMTTVEIGDVKLNKGENSIVFFVSTNYWNQTNSAFRCNVNLASLTMGQTEAVEECELEEEITFNEADLTHTIAKVCDCGAYTLAEPDVKAVSMDFKAIAKEMAKQDFWAVLPSFTMANGVEARYVGGKYGVAMTAEQSAAYDELAQWLLETYGWTIDDVFATFKGTNGCRLIFCADDSVAWGFSHNSYYTNFARDNRDCLGFTVNAPKAGWYAMDIGLSLSNSASTDCISGEGGGAYETFTVNGEEVYAHLGNVGANAVVDYALGAVYLNEGENTLQMKMVANYWNQTNAAYRTNFNMIGIELTEIETFVAPNGTVTVNTNDYVNFETVISADTHTVAVSGAAASAVIDENGDLTVTAGEEIGEGFVTVSSADAEVFTATVNVVTAMTYDCADEDGNGLCDVCIGKIGECSHKATTATITPNGDETHTTELVCDLCGENVLAEEENLNIIKVDFMDFAQKAAQQDFWADLPDETTVSGAAVKRIGVTYESTVEDAMPEVENAAYEALIRWQRETLNWSFDESLMDIEVEDGNMIFISNDGALKWGILHHAYFYNFTDHRSDLALTVIADKAGYYQLDMSYVPQGSTATDYPSYAHVDAGGGYADIYINGELVVDQFCFKCDNTQNNKLHVNDLATVYLQAGGNEIIIRNAANYHNSCTNGAYTGRGNVPVTDLTFTEIDTPNLMEGTVTVAMENVIGNVTTVPNSVVSSNADVAAAQFDADGNVTVTAVADGKTVITVSTVAAEGNTVAVVGKFCVEVGDTVTSNCSDADGDGKCDVCGGEISCKHVYAEEVITDLEDKTHKIETVCAACGEEMAEAVIAACTDADDDDLCDVCGAVVEVPECDHANTTRDIVDNGDGTHTVSVICECGEVISEETSDCADEDTDGVCDVCEAVVEVPCDHTNTTESVVDNGDKTHTITVTCQCGEVVSTETAQCVDEDKDTACDACGATLVTITKFAMAGSNMTLGNELVVNVMFMKNRVTGTGNTIEITHGDAVTTIVQADWESYNAAMYVARIPVAAKEMADSLTVTVKNADGYEIATAYTTSVREYAGKVLAGATSTYSQLMKNLAVDMLNYGAAAQTNFSYNTEDMANNALTEEQAGWATADVACTNNQVKGAKCMGSNLSLESKILLNIIFQLTETAAADKYAMVTYTDYTGKAVEYRVDSFNRFNASMQGVVIDEIVLADAFQLVTVTVYNADGSVYGTGSDSVESYAARTSNDLNAAIMKFASSAYAYLGGTN